MKRSGGSFRLPAEKTLLLLNGNRSKEGTREIALHTPFHIA